MFLKPFSLLCGAALLAFTAESNAQYTVKIPYKQVSVENSNGTAVFKGVPTYGKPGQPDLPIYSVTFLIPTGTNPGDVSVSVDNPVDSIIRGKWYVKPANPPKQSGSSASSTDEYPKDMDVYGQNSFFPSSWTGKVTFGKMREYQLVEIAVNPCKYNPVSGELRMLVGGTLTLSIKSQTGLKSRIVAPASSTPSTGDSQTIKKLKGLIVNPEILGGTSLQSAPAQRSLVAAPAANGEGYAIITTTAIANSSTVLSGFINYLTSKGYNPMLITDNVWGGGTGNTAAENIRSWLQSNYLTYNIQYVLLIGNPDPTTGDVPMKMTYPDQAQSGDLNGEMIPTDFYYAELSGNWDVNGNGHYGEYYDDFQAGGSDKYAEVALGRIPYYGVVTDLNKILQKSINYANETAREWRNNVMLPMVPLDNITPMYHLGEQIKDNILQYHNSGYYRLYNEVDPTVINMYPPIEETPSTETNVTNTWTHNYFGVVTWTTHGWTQGASNVFSTSSVAFLDDNHPSMTFEASCQNSYPEDNSNLAYSILRNGGIATVGATRNSIYWLGQTDFVNAPSVGGIAYSYTNGIMSGYCAGSALNLAFMFSYDWGCASWRNFLTFTLFGCPEMSLDIPSYMPAAPTHLRATSGGTNIFTLTWDDNASDETGYCIEMASSGGVFSQVALVAANASATLISANTGDKRLFRVRAVNGTSYSRYSNIDSSTTYSNLAQGKTVTYSSQQSGNEAYKAVDGNATSTRWAASSGTMPQWYKVDLGGVMPVSGFEIVFERPGSGTDCNDFKIETSNDNTTWTVQLDRSSNTNTAQTQSYFINCSARYVRITISDAPGTYYASMYEFRVFGSSVPAAPTWKTWSIVSDNQVFLEWDPVAGATSYSLKRSTVESGPFLTIAKGLTTTSSYLSNLADNTGYYFIVTAVNSAGESFNSQVVNVFYRVSAPPAAPTYLSVYAGYNPVQSNQLYWTDNSVSETGYQIERAEYGTQNWSTIGSIGKNETGFKDESLSPNTLYKYRVYAYNARGNSAYTAEVNPSLGTPINLVWRLNSYSTPVSISLMWNTDVTNYQGYRIERSTDQVNYQTIGTIDYTNYVFTDANLMPGTSYTYRISTYYGSAISGYIYTESILVPGTVPNAPSGLTTTANSRSQITINWTDNSSNESGFYIERAPSGGSFSQIASVGANVTSYVNTGLSAATTYQYRIRSYNSSGNSAYTSTVSVSTHSNLAPAGTATASTVQSGNAVNNAKDNSTTTRWCASSSSMPQWWKVDLGSSKTISEFEIMFEKAGASGDCNDFKIETSSDNTNWTSRVDRSTNTNTAQTQAYAWDGTARYVRITISDAPGTNWASIYEFRVFGN